MAKADESHQGAGGTARVYKAKDVHKRRVSRKSRSAKNAAPEVAERPKRYVDDPAQPIADDVAFSEAGPAVEPLETHPFSQSEPSEESPRVDQPESPSLEDTLPSTQGDKKGIKAFFSKRVPAIKPIPQSEDGENSPIEDDAPAPTAFSGSEADDAVADNDVKGQPGFDWDGPDGGAGEEGVRSDEAGVAQEDEPKPHGAKRIQPKHILFVLVGLVLLAVVVLGSMFAWNRWGRYNDHADMQGQWYAMGTTVPIEIGENTIRLTDEISYEYEIDDHAKTIRYTFGPMEGQGRYWFSDDRRFFAITDGEGYTDAGTAFEDLVNEFSGQAPAEGGVPFKLPEGEGVIVLCREPGKMTAMVSEAAERGKKRLEEQKAKEKEEAAKKAAEEEAKANAEDAAQAETGTADTGDTYVEYYDDTGADETADQEAEPYEEEYVEEYEEEYVEEEPQQSNEEG